MSRSYGLTADEWLHLAAEGTESEIPPCCGNLSQLREILNALAVSQEPYDAWRGTLTRQLTELLDGDRSYQHELDNREAFPIYNKLMDAIEAEVSNASGSA